MTAQPATFDPKRAHELFDSGESCRSIASTLGVAPSTISRWAKGEGLKFDRSQTDLATRAHTVDLAADRLELAKMMVVASRDMLSRLDGKYTVYAFGGRDNKYREHTLDEPPVEVVRNAVTTAGIAFDKATKVLERSDDGLTGAYSVLDALADGFAKAAAEYEATHTDGALGIGQEPGDNSLSGD